MLLLLAAGCGQTGDRTGETPSAGPPDSLQASPPSNAEQKANVFLAGHKRIPPVATGASGNIEVVLNNDTLTVAGTFRGLSGVYAGAGIHVGTAKEEGNRLYRLEPDLEESKTEGSFKAEKNRYRLNDTQLELLAAGEFYINIYSTDHRRGEIRGQIPPLSPG